MKRWLCLPACGLAAMVVLAVGTPVTGLAEFERDTPVYGDGRAPTPLELAPSVEAAFQAESYAPGSVAALELFNRSTRVTLRLFRVGSEGKHTVGYNEMQGTRVTGAVQLGSVAAGRIVRVRIGQWPSGFYFARLDAGDGRVGFAPFVLRPLRLGEHRVAVVLPTQTWQAYNIRDDDNDGSGGHSWYARGDYRFAALYRPFLNRGVPFNFRSYDLRFLHWLAAHHPNVDYLADGDLDSAPDARTLLRAYDLIVFPGHHEYVTTHEYDVVEGYRNGGGSLVFLSANNFYWQVVKHGNVMERTQQWRDLGRPEAALVGVQFLTNERRFGRYVVLDTKSTPWLFAHTGLRTGSVFGHGGIEIDTISASSPRNVKIVARIPNVFGLGRNADMSIYTTKSGGTVFAAGAFTLAAGVVNPVVSRLIENLWTHATTHV